MAKALGRITAKTSLLLETSAVRWGLSTSLEVAVPRGAGRYFRAVPKGPISALLVSVLELRVKGCLAQDLPTARSGCFGQV